MDIQMKRVVTRSAVICLVASLSAGSLFAQVDFTRYVAIGDSLTMAVSSAGVVETIQRQSYPLLIKEQASGAGSEFEQPLAGLPGVPPPLKLRGLNPLILTPDAGLGDLINVLLPRPYDNLGVSGANVFDTVNTITDFGGAHDVVLRGLGTALEQAVSLSPTFATVWIGNNDVLGAATTGLVIDGVTLTLLDDFEADYRTVVSTLAGTGAQLAVATIPSVTAIPFVTTLPPVLVDPATNEPVIVGGATVPLIGPDGPLSLADKVLLTASELLAVGTGIPVEFGGSGVPLPDEVVLDAGEVSAITNRLNAFNDVIRTVANENNAALMDANAIFDDIVAHGVEVAGVEYTAEFLTGGIFSYDGVHATAFGYALVANFFIEAINAHFGSEIPAADLLSQVFGAQRLSQQSAASGSFIFTKKADKRLRYMLGMPSKKALRKMKRQLSEPPSDDGTPPDDTILITPPGAQDEDLRSADPAAPASAPVERHDDRGGRGGAGRRILR